MKGKSRGIVEIKTAFTKITGNAGFVVIYKPLSTFYKVDVVSGHCPQQPYIRSSRKAFSTSFWSSNHLPLSVGMEILFLQLVSYPLAKVFSTTSLPNRLAITGILDQLELLIRQFLCLYGKSVAYDWHVLSAVISPLSISKISSRNNFNGGFFYLRQAFGMLTNQIIGITTDNKEKTVRHLPEEKLSSITGNKTIGTFNEAFNGFMQSSNDL